MNSLIRYSILQICPSRDRQELVNVGLVAQKGNEWDVRVLPNPKKILALNPGFRPSGLVNIQKSIQSLLAGAENFEVARQRFAKQGNDPKLHSFVGQFQALDAEEYEEKISGFMKLLVLPPSISKPRPALRRTRLSVSIRNKFKEFGILGGKQEDIQNHKVVEHFPVSPNKGLYAEFALRNGVMNFTETIDFDVQDVSRKIVEAQAKALVLSQAREHFGNNTKSYVIVSGKNRFEARESLNLLRDSARVFEMQNPSEMTEYFGLITSAASQ